MQGEKDEGSSVINFPYLLFLFLFCCIKSVMKNINYQIIKYIFGVFRDASTERKKHGDYTFM